MLSVCVPLACGVKLSTLQLQLAPLVTRPLNSPITSGTLAAAGAPKQRSCGSRKSMTRARLRPAARSARNGTPSMFRRAHWARSLRGMRAARRLGRLHDGVTMLAGTQRQAAEETVKYRGKLCLDVSQRKELLVEQPLAALAIPLQAVELAGTPAPLDHEAYRVGMALRGVRRRGRQ